MDTLIVIVTESALELVPQKILTHPAIINYAKKRSKRSEEILLDRSYHHFAMNKLVDAEKRGRPDIIHLTLLSLLGSPLNRRGSLETYVHTREDKVIKVDALLRLPKNYLRFIGLIEQLYKYGRVPLQGNPLLEIYDCSLSKLIKQLNSAKIIGLSMKGSFKQLEDLCKETVSLDKVIFLLGGFPKGHFNSKTTQVIDELVKIYPETLDSWLVACRLIYQFELALEI